MGNSPWDSRESDTTEHACVHSWELNGARIFLGGFSCVHLLFVRNQLIVGPQG